MNLYARHQCENPHEGKCELTVSLTNCMSNETNNESNNTARVNNSLKETMMRLLKMISMSSEPPPESFGKDVFELSGLLSEVLISKTLEGKLPNGLLVNVNFVSTLRVVEDSDRIVRFERMYVVPNDVRVVIQFGQRITDLLQTGIAVPLTALVVDKSVVAGEGYRALKTLQQIKERCLNLFPDSHFEANEFPLVDPQMGNRFINAIMGDAVTALHKKNEEEITQIIPRESFEQISKAMTVNPELMVEKLKSLYEPSGLIINFVPVINMEDTNKGVSTYESGNYNTIALGTETGVLEISRVNPYLYPDKPAGLI